MFSLLIFLPGATALAHEDGPGQKIQNRLDHKGDVIDQRLDQKSDWASEHGKEGLANYLDRKGNRIDRKLDRKGQKIHRKMHKKSQKIDRKMHNTGFQHGMSHARNNGKGKKLGLGRGLQKGEGHR